MISKRTKWQGKNVLIGYLCFSLFEILLIVVSFLAITTTDLLFQCAYFIGWCLTAVSVPLLPYALLVAVRQVRGRNYAALTLAVLAAIAAVLAVMGGTTILIFQTAMAGTPEF